MARNQKSYDNEFKAQAVKLAQKIGGIKQRKMIPTFGIIFPFPKLNFSCFLWAIV